MSNVSVGPKERTVWFGEGNRERYDEANSEVEKKACEKYHVYVRELPDCLALQDGPYKNESYK